jgi:parallel beta-helix repeat protein
LKSNRKPIIAVSLLALALTLLTAPALLAATHCVSRSGQQGCFTTINAAIGASAPGDVIQVWPGRYGEDVVVSKPLSLVGVNRQETIINAIGLMHGVEITGQNHVVIRGFTIENANLSGVLINDASAVTIDDNHIVNNDKNLSAGQCPGLPPEFAGGEAIDCGEGIHMNAVDHSTVSNNVVERNAGGILVADDTGATHDNVISDNIVQNNKPDCGITLASHGVNTGVFRNTVAGNVSLDNGGAGVGIFAPGPGSQAYANRIVDNRLIGNAQPGVTMHNHAAPGVNGVPPLAPPVVYSDNAVVGNFIARNAADTADAATSGPTGINLFSLVPMPGTIINQNTIVAEDLDIALNVPAGDPANGPDPQLHLNNLVKPVGVQNNGSVIVDATENWWGCTAGPGRHGCSTIQGNNVIFEPWLTRPAQSQSEHAPSKRD